MDERSVDVWYRRLREAIPTVVLQLRDEEIEEIRRLYCVDLERRSAAFDGGRVPAPVRDAQRWRAATEAVIAAVESVREREMVVRRRLCPPYGPWTELLWRLRWGFRRERLRREHDAQLAALEDEVRDVYRAYRDAAGDLTEHVLAWREQQALEQRQREERLRAERVAAVGGDVWAYDIGDHGRHRRMTISLPALEPGGGDRPGMTARQVRQAIEDERGRDPYIWIDWTEETVAAMRAWHADRVGGVPAGDGKVMAWAALTGVVVTPIVLRPGELEEPDTSRSNRGSGPSSNYWSPSSFGTSF